MKHLRSLFDLSIDEFHEILGLADSLKTRLAAGQRPDLLKNRTLALLFEKASLRTRVSFEAGMVQLGGASLYLNSDVGWKERETISDFVKVLAGYCDFVVCRAISQTTVNELASHNVMPVINGLTDESHPCQALADIMTMREACGPLRGKQLTFVGDGNNVARSLIQSAAICGMKFRLVGPEGFRIASNWIDRVNSQFGEVDFDQSSDIASMVANADFLYTDVWTSMGQEAEAKERSACFSAFQINAAMMQQAPSQCKVLHCLPARRGLEITDEVMDSPNSIVFPQAENRMHLQKGLLVWLGIQNGFVAPAELR
ncbi:MAG: ornithine carbamoyltransferase [Pirellula sp.]